MFPRGAAEQDRERTEQKRDRIWLEELHLVSSVNEPVSPRSHSPDAAKEQVGRSREWYVEGCVE